MPLMMQDAGAQIQDAGAIPPQGGAPAGLMVPDQGMPAPGRPPSPWAQNIAAGGYPQTSPAPVQPQMATPEQQQQFDASRAAAAPAVQMAPIQISPPQRFAGPAQASSPNPLGGLREEMRVATRGYLDSFDKQKEAKQDIADATAARLETQAYYGADAAQRMQIDAEKGLRVQQAANQRAETEMSAMEDERKALAEKKIDPQRLFRGNEFAGVAVLVGATLGGFMSSANGGKNVFMDHLDKLIDRDIDAQKEDMANGRNALAMRNTMFGQRMAMTQDNRLATMQHQNMQYEATKQMIASRMAGMSAPIARAEGAEAISQIDEKQSFLRKEIAVGAYQGEVARQQAAAAAAAAANERAWQHSVKTVELGQADRKLGTEERQGDRRLDIEEGKAAATSAGGAGKLADDLSREKVPQLRKAIDTFSKKLEPYIKKNDPIPGISPHAFGVDSPFNFGDIKPSTRATGRELESQLDDLIDTYGHTKSGAAVGAEEKATYIKLIRGNGSPQDLQKGLEWLRSQVDSLESNARQGAGSKAASQYDANGFQPDAK